MGKIVIKPMESEDEINGKAFVHWKSWHETYPGLIDAGYLEAFTLEKCVATAHRWPGNILVAKDGEQVVALCGIRRVPRRRGCSRSTSSPGAAGERKGDPLLRAVRLPFRRRDGGDPARHAEHGRRMLLEGT